MIFTKKNIFNKLQQDLLRYFENDSIKVKINFEILEEKNNAAPPPPEEFTEGIYFYHPDHLGSATFLTDKIGKPYSFYLNLPFGESMAEQRSYTGSFTNRWKFTGKELDEETGLYYFGARFYNPVTSLWLSVDPLAEKYPAYSPYNYCVNNPIIFIDPDGREITPWYFGGLPIYSKIASHVYKSFETSYFSLINNSKVFSSSIKRLEKSDRTYTFQTQYQNKRSENWNGYFQPGINMYGDDNTINFVVNFNIMKAGKSTVFEEVVHAAQYDFYKDNNDWTNKTMIGLEVEAKLAKAIEGLDLHSYEAFNVDSKILSKIRNGKNLSGNELNILSDAINILSTNVAAQYGLDYFDFDGTKDLKYIEKIYGQKLYVDQYEVIVTAPKKD